MSQGGCNSIFGGDAICIHLCNVLATCCCWSFLLLISRKKSPQYLRKIKMEKEQEGKVWLKRRLARRFHQSPNGGATSGFSRNIGSTIMRKPSTKCGFSSAPRMEKLTHHGDSSLLLDVPNEILSKIFLRLSWYDLEYNVKPVCKRFHATVCAQVRDLIPQKRVSSEDMSSLVKGPDCPKILTMDLSKSSLAQERIGRLYHFLGNNVDHNTIYWNISRSLKNQKRPGSNWRATFMVHLRLEHAGNSSSPPLNCSPISDDWI